MRGVVTAALGLALAACGKPDYCDDAGMAYVMSQNFVKKRLISPSSAKFPPSAVRTEKIGACTYRIVGVFDSQNAFGAMLRGTYEMEISYDRSTEMYSARNVVVK